MTRFHLNNHCRFLVITLLGLLFSNITLSATYTVTNTDDSNVMSPITGSLRWAINQVNAGAGSGDIIDFNISGSGPHTITLSALLPLISKSCVIDGTTQSGYVTGSPTIVIAAGSNTSFQWHGLMFIFTPTANHTVKGLHLENFYPGIGMTHDGVESGYQFLIQDNVFTANQISIIIGFDGGLEVNNVTVKGNYIDATGSNNQASSRGIYINGDNNIIGGNNTGEFNTIINTKTGIQVFSLPIISVLSNGNIFSENIIYSSVSSHKAIDLLFDSNDDKQPPVITSFSGGVVSGTAEVGDIIEIFGGSDEQNANVLLGVTSANGAGNWQQNITPGSWTHITATATDMDLGNGTPQNTSELGYKEIIPVPILCDDAVENQDNIIDLVSPDDFATVTPASNLTWDILSVPALDPSLSSYAVAVEVSPEIVLPSGQLGVNWTSPQLLTSVQYFTILGTGTDSKLLSSLGLTASNIPQTWYWRVGILHKTIDAEGHQPVTWSATGKFIVAPESQAIAAETYLTGSSHTNKINWVYGVSYLDDNITSEGIAYIDGLGKSRQVQSRLNSENKIMTVEAAYSTEGGGSVLTLPAPKDGSDFGYATAFFDVVDGSGDPRDFSTIDFDRELISGSTASLITPSAVNTSVGSVGRYYSSHNADAYVDDAQGYPYAYNVGYRSPVQRPLLTAGGVGNTFKITGGKEYKHFYGLPTQEELDRVYGVSKAPEKDNVNRSVTYDPNGVGYITYKDNEGKVIATALTHCNAPNLKALEEDGMDGFIAHVNPVENSLLDSTTFEGISSSKFFIPCATDVSLDYSLELSGFQVDGIPCAECEFDVEIKLFNEATGQEYELTYDPVLTPAAAVCDGSSELVQVISQTLEDLPGPATYMITRKIKPHVDAATGENVITKAINEYKEYLQANQNTTLLSEFETLYNTEEAWYVLRKTKSAVALANPASNGDICYDNVSTFAGSGDACNREGVLTSADLFFPRGVTKDHRGNMYIADPGSQSIRRINTNGQVTTFVGSDCLVSGYTDATGSNARFNNPYDIVFYTPSPADSGYLFVADKNNNVIRKIDIATRVVTTLAGTGAGLSAPEGLGVDASGNIYSASTGNHKIFKTTQGGTTTLVAGSGTFGNNDAQGSSATFATPTDVAADAQGNLYVPQRGAGNLNVRKIDPSANVTTWATSPPGYQFTTPASVVVNPSGNVVLSDEGNNRIYVLYGGTSFDHVTNLTTAGYMDGPVIGTAKFNSPAGLYMNTGGDIYVADENNHRIRFIKSTDCGFQNCFIEDPCEDETCQDDLWYVDKISVSDISQSPYTKLLQDLDGDADNNNTPGDEQYRATSVTSVGTISSGTIWDNFRSAYERMHWVIPTITNMERFDLGSGSEVTTLMKFIDDDKKLLDCTADFYLLKVSITKPTCVERCTPKEYAPPCSTQCEEQRLAYKADMDAAWQALEALPSPASYGLFVGGSGRTIVEWINRGLYPLPGILLDKMNIPGDLKKQNELRVYQAYEDAHDAFTRFNIQDCIDLCNGTDPGPCKTCGAGYHACVFGNMDELMNGYNYLLAKWDANGGTNSDFPYDELDDLMPYQDGNTSLPRVPDTDELDNLGKILFDYIVDNISGTFVRANWNLVGGTCSNCAPPSSGSPTNCAAAPLRDMSAFPSILIAPLQNANATCVTDFTACLQMNGDAAAQQAYMCQQQLDQCELALGSSSDPIYTSTTSPSYGRYTEFLDSCHAAYARCTTSTPTSPNFIETHRKHSIRETVLELYPALDSASLEEQVEAIYNETASLSLMELESYLFDYLNNNKCKLDCQADFRREYKLWLTQKLLAAEKEIRNKFRIQCIGRLKEKFDINYEQHMYHYTLYNYDFGNNLTSTVPPDGIDYINLADPAQYTPASGTTPRSSRVPAHRMKSNYTPTSLYTVKASSPDEGETRYLYDKAGRVRFSQTAEQKARGLTLNMMVFSYVKYDAEERVIEAGEYRDITHNICYWNYGECPCICLPNSGGLEGKVNEPTWPTNPSATFEETYIAYDEPSINPAVSSYVLNNQYNQKYLEGRVVKTWNAEGVTHYSYDAHGRVTFAVQEVNALRGSLNNPFQGAAAYKTIDYVYQNLTSRVDQIIYQKNNVQEQFRQRYTYDDDYRLIKTEVSRNSGTSWLPASEYEYYTHGPLKRTGLGDKIQDVDLTYNINGWLKAINNPISTGSYANESNEGGTDPVAKFAKDIFAEGINYYNGDFTRTGVGMDAASAMVPQTGSYLKGNSDFIAKDLFNGNISSVISFTGFRQLTSGSPTNNELMAQGYAYDMLNRLKDVYVETQDINSGFSGFASSADVNDPYGVHLTYDANGNIENLVRRSLSGGSGIAMDNMTYRYAQTTTDYHSNTKKTTNKLAHVNDAVGAATVGDIGDQGSGYVAGTPSTHNYKYDAKGRIISDVAEGITNIDWTVYDKVEKITKSNGDQIVFTYNSKQQRQTKTVHIASSSTFDQTIYSYDASGILMATYNLDNIDDEYVLNEHQVYGLSRIGNYKVDELLVVNPTLPTNDAAKQRFEISDHLGSVRAVVTGEKDGSNNLNIVSLSDYSDFGWMMAGRSFVAENSRYGYQGSERDPEYLAGSAYTTEYRMLDVRLGRWFSPDPMIDPSMSPYASMDNNPIALTDVLGLAASGGVRSGGTADACPSWGGGGSHGSPGTTAQVGGAGVAVDPMNSSRAGSADMPQPPSSQKPGVIPYNRNSEGLKILPQPEPTLKPKQNQSVDTQQEELGTFDQVLVDLLVGFAKRYLPNVDQLSEYEKQKIFRKSSTKSAAILLYEFATGTGEEKRVFNEQHGDAIAIEVKKKVEQEIMKKLKARMEEKGVTMDDFEYDEFGYEFSPDDASLVESMQKHKKALGEMADGDIIAMVLGGMSVKVRKVGTNELQIKLINKHGKRSLKLHLDKDSPRNKNKKTPLGDIWQTIIFYSTFK